MIKKSTTIKLKNSYWVEEFVTWRRCTKYIHQKATIVLRVTILCCFITRDVNNVHRVYITQTYIFPNYTDILLKNKKSNEQIYMKYTNIIFVITIYLVTKHPKFQRYNLL